MQENLLEEGLNSFQKEIVDRMDSFDLEDFFSYDGDYRRALGLITKNQMLMLNCVHGEDEIDDPQYNTLLELYKAVYGINSKIPYDNWQKQVNEDGNIVIQLFFDRNSTIWIPDEINDEQLEMLENLNRRIKLIASHNPEEFDKEPMAFSVKYGYVEFELKNNLDEIINLLKSKENEESITGKSR